MPQLITGDVIGSRTIYEIFEHMRSADNYSIIMEDIVQLPKT
jgi:hypothetical protein